MFALKLAFGAVLGGVAMLGLIRAVAGDTVAGMLVMLVALGIGYMVQRSERDNSGCCGSGKRRRDE